MSNELDIAIIGMAGRFPGADNLAQFWDNLAGGIESITRFSDQELLDSGVPASCLTNSSYVKAAPVLREPSHFAAEFFGVSPTEARTMDPQHRILLELAYEALENAGYEPGRCPGRVGVFTGAALNTYFLSAGLNNRLAEEYIPTLIGNDKDFLSTRISYKLNLKGPSVTVQTACSTSLVAIHLARQSLLSGETDMALAGAVSVRAPHRCGYFCDGGGVLSPDGRVRAFDARANGTVFGSGAGILVLKRLADARSDRETIHAVIKGTAVNNDGSEKAGYTAPGVNSQADAVVEALANAGVTADTLTYVEAHGSGTPVGDPIEVRALTKAFRNSTRQSGFCAIGSVKTNVGHLDAAAAMAGIIKTVLSLKHRQLPPSLHFTEPNPNIDFLNSPFYVNTKLREWTVAGPRRAAVISTGMGGTNGCIVLEEAPESEKPTPDESAHLLVLSGATPTALDQVTDRLREVLRYQQNVSVSDTAHTLRVGRKAFPFRRALVCTGREDAIAVLGESGSKRILAGHAEEANRRPIVFLLPGIGDHYVGMGHELYETWGGFREEVDRCARIIESQLSIDIRNLLYPPGQAGKREILRKGIDLKKMLGCDANGLQDPHAVDLNKTLFAQPALFTIEYALARLWQSFGVHPDAIVGHSLGEYVAACLAGVLSLEDALHLVIKRAELVQALPAGAMLAVNLSENELLPLLKESLSVSLINGPQLCVVAGPVASVAELKHQLSERGVICRRVQNAHAFHSRMLDPIVDAYEREVRSVQLNEPKIPYLSNVTGGWIKPDEATSAAYWARHANHTARFNEALSQLWKLKNPILLETGPGRTLSVLAMQHPARRTAGEVAAVASLRHSYENQSDVEVLWSAVGKLWVAGADLVWNKVETTDGGRRIPLPTYPFERDYYWLEPKPAQSVLPAESESSCRNPDNWFYVPVWKQSPFPNEVRPESDPRSASWIIVADRFGGGGRLKAKLQELGIAAVFVRFGEQFVERPDGSFEIRPATLDDYLKVFRRVVAASPSRIHLVHLGSVTTEKAGTSDVACARNQDFGYYSLLRIVQAIGELDLNVPVRLGIVSNRIQDVTGEESLCPEMATVLGLSGVIPKEFPNISCFSVDLADGLVTDELSNSALERIIAEFAVADRGELIAYRGRHRWVRQYDQVRLPKLLASSVGQPGAGNARLRRGGVYLITGGTGGLGLAMARYLAATCQPKIILTKQSAFPDKSSWRNLVTENHRTEAVRRTVQSLLEIEALGAEVEVLVADVADREAMQVVVSKIIERFGAIHGVIHAAGRVRAGLIQTKSREMMEKILAPKVYGTLILFDLIKDLKPDFLMLFSSITSILTPYAEADYSAANAFLDAFGAFANSHAPFRTITINWPGWKEAGQLVELQSLPGLEQWKKDALERAIATKDGLDAFQRVLHSDLTQVIVSPENLAHLMQESGSESARFFVPGASGNKAFAKRNGTARGADRPTSPLEQGLAEIWREVFGFDGIGIDDSFLELGGHSLMAIQILSRVRRTYSVDLTLRAFFATPTISGMAARIESLKFDGGTDRQTLARESISL